MKQIDDIRSLFPQLGEKVYGKPLVYLDNAATSLRPVPVLDKWEEMSVKYNSNLHRAVHRTAQIATDEYESTREAVRAFIGAPSAREIVFTSGATAALNLVAFCFGESFVGPGDEIIVSEAEHHSNIVPWQLMCERKGARLRTLPVGESGELRIDLLPSLINDRTRLVCVCHISNVLGIINPLKQIVNICHSKDCPVLVDGAQGVVHDVVDVQETGCDFYVFSGHKLYAAPGTGVLYAREKYLEAFPPYMGGGEMIETVSWSGTTYARPPHKFEAGTQNISGTPTLKPAIEMARALRGAEIEAAQKALRDYMLEELAKIPGLRLFGLPEKRENKIPLFSFCVEGAHHEDLALLLDKMGVAVRSGQMCAEPLMDRFGVTGMLRASFAPYNSMEEAEYFIKSLRRAITMLRG